MHEIKSLVHVRQAESATQHPSISDMRKDIHLPHSCDIAIARLGIKIQIPSSQFCSTEVQKALRLLGFETEFINTGLNLTTDNQSK